MNVYIFGKLQKWETVQSIQAAMREKGHHITHDWTLAAAFYEQYPEKMNEALRQEQSLNCMNGIMASDAVVGYVTEDLKYQGSFVEMGIALIAEKPVVLIGHAMDSCIFTSLVEKVDKVSEALCLLDQMEAESDR